MVAICGYLLCSLNYDTARRRPIFPILPKNFEMEWVPVEGGPLSKWLVALLILRSEVGGSLLINKSPVI